VPLANVVIWDAAAAAFIAVGVKFVSEAFGAGPVTPVDGSVAPVVGAIAPVEFSLPLYQVAVALHQLAVSLHKLAALPQVPLLALHALQT